MFICNNVLKKLQTSGCSPSSPTSFIGKPIDDSPPIMDNIFRFESLS